MNTNNSKALIDNIIELLSEEKSSLSAALLKTKLLLHQIGKKELADWVNNELNGYPDNVSIPEYRILLSQVLANASNIAYEISNHPIPLAHLTPDQKKDLEVFKITQSIFVLEKMLSDPNSNFLIRSIPMEANSILAQGLANGFKIQRAWCQTPSHDLNGIFIQVRSRLLDFILELKESIGDAIDEAEILHKIDSIDASGIFSNKIYGNNNTILIGDHNSQNVRINIIKGDLESLAQNLIKAGVSIDEVEALKVAIRDDEKNHGQASFKGNTGKWLTNLLHSAAKGSLKISSDVISSVITKAITSYIGL